MPRKCREDKQKITYLCFSFSSSPLHLPSSLFPYIPPPFPPLSISLTIPMHLRDSHPSFLRERDPPFVQCTGMTFSGKEPCHWWWPIRVPSLLGPVNCHHRNRCYPVYFSSKVTKRKPMHLYHHLFKWAKFGAENWRYDKNISNIFSVSLTPHGSFVPRGSRFSKWPSLFSEHTDSS